MVTALLVAFLMLALSFYYSGVEIAFLSASPLKIELKKKQGSWVAKKLSWLKNETSTVHPAILIGNTIALVIFTYQVEGIIGPSLDEWFASWTGSWQQAVTLQEVIRFLILTGLGTLIILVFAEYIPKAIFKRTADQIIFPSTYLLVVSYIIFYPLVWLINVIARVILRYLLGIRQTDETYVMSKQDLDIYIRQVVASSDEPEVSEINSMLTNAMEFRDTKARDFMIPRTKIEAVSLDATLEELMASFIETQLSKLIVYGESLDDVQGFVHSRSMFEQPDSMADIVQEVLIVPETMPADMLLVEFNENKKTVAIVVDEFGGTSGLITMEDLLEEVFGEIEDEYDVQEVEEDMEVRKNADGSMVLGARQEINDLNESQGLELPEDEYYSTLGGLFTYFAEDIPKQGEHIIVGPYQLTAMKVTLKRIILVHLKRV